MAKFGPPKARIANPAAPKRVLTAQEAENVLTMPEPEVTKDSDIEPTEEEQSVMDEVFGSEGEDEEEYETHDDEEPGEGEDEIADKPTRPATQPKASKKAGGNLSTEQQKYMDEIGALGRDQGKGVSSLIFLAEKVVTIGATAVFENSQLKDIYMHFRKNSNSAAGKNAEVGEQDHTVVSNTSKLRTFYKVGGRFGTDGWSKMLKVARDIHVNILRTKDERKTLRSKQLVPTYEALVKIASVQMRQEADAKGIKHNVYPQLLTPEQIKNEFIDENKKETEPTVQDVIKAGIKAIERVIRGKTNPNDGSQTREAFEAPKDGEDDESVGYALVSALSWMRDAGERFEEGFKANYDKEMADAKAAQELRHKKAQERKAKELAEAAARKTAREAEAKRKASEAALAKEATPTS